MCSVTARSYLWLCFLLLSFCVQYVNNSPPRDNYSKKPQLHVIFPQLPFCRIVFWYSGCLLCSRFQNKSELTNRASTEMYRECLKSPPLFLTNTLPSVIPITACEDKEISVWRNDLERTSHCICIDYCKCAAIRANLFGNRSLHSHKGTRGKMGTWGKA